METSENVRRFSACAETAGLPRLVYIGDVPIESTYHGSAVLYRLLANYPADRLLVIEGDVSLPSQVEFRLRGVRYARLSVAHRRLLWTPLHRAYASWLTIS